jgi:hypothetical protein
LGKLGATNDQKESVLEEVRRFALSDYVFHILGGATIPQGLELHQFGISEWHELRSRMLDSPPTPQVIRDFLAKYRLDSDKCAELLKDYEWFLEHNEHRRPDAWCTLTNEGRS